MCKKRLFPDNSEPRRIPGLCGPEESEGGDNDNEAIDEEYLELLEEIRIG